MSSSEEYLQGLRGGVVDWGAAVRDMRAMFGNHAADRLASALNVTRRTAERWLARAEGRGSQGSTPRAAKQLSIVEAMRDQRAARRVRAGRVVHAGRVSVAYSGTGRGEGSRYIGDVPVAAEDMEVVAQAIEAGDYGLAADLLDDVVLDAYGVPEGTLSIEDYETGFELGE
jgi:hypothetical protein